MSIRGVVFVIPSVRSVSRDHERRQHTQQPPRRQATGPLYLLVSITYRLAPLLVLLDPFIANKKQHYL